MSRSTCSRVSSCGVHKTWDKEVVRWRRGVAKGAAADRDQVEVALGDVGGSWPRHTEVGTGADLSAISWCLPQPRVRRVREKASEGCVKDLMQQRPLFFDVVSCRLPSSVDIWFNVVSVEQSKFYLDYGRAHPQDVDLGVDSKEDDWTEKENGKEGSHIQLVAHHGSSDGQTEAEKNRGEEVDQCGKQNRSRIASLRLNL